MCFSTLFGQGVQSLKPDITVDSILKVKPGASKLAFDPISKHLFYTCSDGKIVEVFEDIQQDSLRYTVNDHGLTRLQGLCFLDSTLYLSGNIWYSNTGIGLIVKGKLQVDGSRIWTTMVLTEAYPTSSSSGDHGFTGINVDPSKQFLFFSGGSRTSFGEVISNNGNYPGMREQALTSKIYRIPIDAENLYWPNDSTFLMNSGFVFAEGTRNAYDMAWNAQDHLFAVDNAGERDDPEELNWIQEGQHYGFPWRIGGNVNPLTNPSYDASQDPLINPNNEAYLAGHFNADPNFPPIPAGIQFTEPLRNYGNAADFYKDENTGQIMRASETGTSLRTFTAHRSPLGLIIDREHEIGSIYQGKAFVLSFMPGGDSTGYTPLSPWGSPCPFVDSSRELVMMDLQYDTLLADYTIHSANIVTGFYLPVDAEQVENSIYVIENNGVLWKVNFPNKFNPPICYQAGLITYPNPFSSMCNVYFPNPSKQFRNIKLYQSNGQLAYESAAFDLDTYPLSVPKIAAGEYTLVLEQGTEILAHQKIIIYD
jgi:glucose/arabinose dehydrogenase